MAIAAFVQMTDPVLTDIRLHGVVNHMKTALNIYDRVMTRLKREAARQGKTMSELVEAVLRMLLEQKKKDVPLSDLPYFDGGVPRVNVANREALYEFLPLPHIPG